jgi:energy-coupling factor transporter ATP-binding protein EcfA2
VKIMMLGHSGVGKTTFMACMYAMLQEERGGFCVQAREQAVHDSMIELALNVVRGGAYPAPTASKSSYDLVLFHNREAVFGFEWVDYRGNALNESATSDLSSLLEEINSADGLILFFDGTELEKGGQAARAAAGRLQYLLTQAVNTQERVIPVAIVITKTDLLSDPDKAVAGVRGLCEIIAASRTIHGALIFTAAGEQLLHNVEKPTLFVLHKGISGALMQMRAKFEEEFKEARRLEGNANVIDDISSWWSGTSSWTDLARRRFAEGNQIVELHNQLVDPANGLKELLTDVTMF